MNIQQLNDQTLTEIEFGLAAPLRVPVGPAAAEILVKKSRFLGSLLPLARPEDAEPLLASVSRRDATHNTWAWRIGQRHQFSDDGEPGGTAGRPIFTVLEGSGLDLALLVVTRWFGGIKLGSGGLVRAYSQAAQAAIAAAPVRLLLPRVRLEVAVPYQLQSGFYRLLDAFEARKLGEGFDDQGVLLRFALLRERQAAFQEELTTLSRGSLVALEPPAEVPDAQS